MSQLLTEISPCQRLAAVNSAEVATLDALLITCTMAGIRILLQDLLQTRRDGANLDEE